MTSLSNLSQPSNHNSSVRRPRSNSKDGGQDLEPSSSEEDDMQSPRKHARTSKRMSAIRRGASPTRIPVRPRALFPSSPNRKPSSLSLNKNAAAMKESIGPGSRSAQSKTVGMPATAPAADRRSKFDMSGIQCDLPKLSAVPFASSSSSPDSPSPFNNPPSFSLPHVSTTAAKHPLSLSSDVRRGSVESLDSIEAVRSDEEEEEEPESELTRRMAGAHTMPANTRGKTPKDSHLPDLKKSLTGMAPPPQPAHQRRGSNAAKPPTSWAFRSGPLFASYPLPSSSVRPSNPKSPNTLSAAAPIPEPSASPFLAVDHSNVPRSRQRSGSDASSGATYLESLHEDRSSDMFAPREPSFARYDPSGSVFGSPAARSPFLTSTPKRERSETAPGGGGGIDEGDSFFSPARKSSSLDDLFRVTSSADRSLSGLKATTSTPHSLNRSTGRKRNCNGAIVSGAHLRSQLAANSPMVASSSSPFISSIPLGTEEAGFQAPDMDMDIDEEDPKIAPPSPSWKHIGHPLHVPALTDSSSIASSLASSRDSSRLSLRSSLSSSISTQPQTAGLPDLKSRRPSDAFDGGNSLSASMNHSFKDVKPLASAFESRGLLSKKGRYPRDSGVTLDFSDTSLLSATNLSALNNSTALSSNSLSQSTKRVPDTPCKPSTSILPAELKQSKVKRPSHLASQVASPMSLDSPQHATDSQDQSPLNKHISKVIDSDSPERDSSPSASPCPQQGRLGPSKKFLDTPSNAAPQRPGLFRRRSSGQMHRDMPTFGRSSSMAGESAATEDDEPMTPSRRLNKNGLFIKGTNSFLSQCAEAHIHILVPPRLAVSPQQSPVTAAAAIPEGPTDDCVTPVSANFTEEQHFNAVDAISGQQYPTAPGRPSHPPPAQRRPTYLHRHSGSSVVTLKQLEAQEPDRFESNYQVHGILGRGVSSEAFTVFNVSTGQLSAVKRIRGPPGGAKERARRLEEVDILRHLTQVNEPNPFIVQLKDAWEQAGQLYIETELCEHGNLREYLNAFGNEEGLDEGRQWKIAFELSSAVAFIHHHQMLHLDIKPANVFISSQGSLKLGDFGLATRWPQPSRFEIIHGAGIDTEASASGLIPNRPRARSVGVATVDLEREGDREYIAPEVLRGLYGKPADAFR